MPTTWPYLEFGDYLRALMKAASIPDYADLSRRTGVSQTQFSHWRRGTSQPSRESLTKIAPVLQVPPVSLWLAAGIVDTAELDLSQQPDMTVIPREIRELLGLFARCRTDDQRQNVLRSVAILTAGLRADMGIRDTPGRRKAG